MSKNPALAVQILGMLGAPLVGAAEDVAARQGAAGDQRAAAEKVAELLNKSVQIGMSLSSLMDLRAEEAQTEAARLALVGIAAQLVAAQYRQNGRPPGDADLKRLSTGLEAVLIFADSFAPGAAKDSTILENMDAARTVSAGTETLTAVQYVNALAPLAGAVAAFPFGRGEKKLAQEIADRLILRSKTLRETLGFTGDMAANKTAELRLLSSLAHIYAECHREETARLMALDEKSRTAMTQGGGALPMEGVWQSFETRCAMLETLTQTATGNGAAGKTPLVASGSKDPVAPVAESPAVPPPDVSPPAAPPLPPVSAAVIPSGSTPDNPMSFFKKKTDDAAGKT